METLQTPPKLDTPNPKSQDSTGILTSTQDSPKDLVNGDQENSIKDNTMPSLVLDQGSNERVINDSNGGDSFVGVVEMCNADEGNSARGVEDGNLHEVEVKGVSSNNGQDSATQVIQVVIEENPLAIVSREIMETMKEGDELESDEEDVDYSDYIFCVGEFVWAKTLNRPWWPGQIYDPSDASKDISMYYRKDRLLVAFFGDETAAWCYPTLVKPFQRKFRMMLKQGNSPSFRGAVEEALNRFSRCVELEMTCSCVPAEIQAKLAKPLASSSGIRKGVVVPEGKFLGLSVKEFEPVNFLARLRCIAEVVCDVSELERTVLRSQLSAFKQANGWCQLHVYLELLGIQDNRSNVSGAAMDVFEFDDSMEDSLVWPSYAKGSAIRSNSLTEKIHLQKQRSVNSRLAVTSWKRKKNKDFEVGLIADLEQNGSSSSKSAYCSEEQKKVKLLGPPSPLSDSNDRMHLSDGVQATEENKTGSVTRERKKSKYLSPPYTNLSVLSKSLISLKDSVPSPLNVSRFSRGEESFGRTGGLIKCRSGTITRKQNDEEKIDASMDPSKILSELYYAAMDPMYVQESKRYDCFKKFLINLRCYQRESDPQLLKYLENEPVSSQNDIHKTDHTTIEGGAERREREGVALGLSGEDMGKTSQQISLDGTAMKEESKKNTTSQSPEKKYFGIILGLRSEKLHETGSQKFAGDAKRKGRDWKEDARSQVAQRKSVAVPLGSQGEDVSATNFLASKGSGLESGGIDWTEDGRLQNSQRKLFDNIVDLPGSYMHGTDLPTSETGPKKRGRKRKKEAVSGAEDARLHDSQRKLSDSTDGLPGESMHSHRTDHPEHPTSEGGARKRGRKRKIDVVSGMEDARLQSSQTKLFDGTVGLTGDCRIDHPISEGGPKKRGRKRKSDTVSGSTVISSGQASCIDNKNMHHNNEAVGETSTALLLNFGPGVPLPTKEDLITLFGRFGALDELETGVMKDSGSAQVVYLSRCNAEEAFSSSQKTSPFGSAVVNYQLQYSRKSSTASIPKVNIKQCIPSPMLGNTLAPLSALPPITEVPPLQYVRQNLENMTSVLEKAGDKLPPEEKAHLESKIKGLLSRVESMA